MDENKFEKLKELQYTIAPTCGTCICGCFKELEDWGTCSKHTYSHLKHTGGAKGTERQLSVFKYGGCSHHKFDDNLLKKIGKYSEFICKYDSLP